MSSEYTEQLRLRYAPEDLFDLVSNVREYPEFIELITAMRVTREDVTDGVGTIEADARVRYRFVRERFSSRVKLDRPNREIDVTYLSGPFDDLANCWRFHELSDGSTLIDFWIRYKFRNPLLQMLVDTNRGRAVRYLIRAFEGKAQRTLTPIGEASIDLDSEKRRLNSA